MELDPTRRFSSRVDDYTRFRPSYPEAIIPVLATEYGLRPASVIADIGSGTGLLSTLFLRHGCEVFGVEPNAEMRAAGERELAAEPRFHSIEGRAEDTSLAPASVDFVTAGQAFHWFEPAAAKAEFRRILRPPGWVILAWNERLVEGRFLSEYEQLLHRYSPDYARVDHRRIDSDAIDQFFGPDRWKLATFPNDQHFDLEGVLGRLHSSSYAPPPGTEAYNSLNRDITALFEECHQDGVVAFRHVTKVYVGSVSA